MLVTCWECDQVIEIQQMHEHLIEECQNASAYQYHADCKQVILREDYAGH